MTVIDTRFDELLNLIPSFKKVSQSSITEAANLISKSFTNGNKILVCGNGGSAADSQHFAAEFVNVFSRSIDRDGLPAIALTTDSSVLTSIANDFAFENTFARQVQALARSGDILIVFTTSGSSINCINAVQAAISKGIKTIAFTRTNSEISKLANLTVEVPSENTQHIQECHLLAYHVVAELVEIILFGSSEIGRAHV